MKNAIYVSLAACALVFAACGGGEEAEEDPYANTNATEDAATLCDCIERQMTGDATEEECDKLADTFEKKYENSFEAITYATATAGCAMGAVMGGTVDIMGDVAEAFGDSAAAEELHNASDSIDAAMDEAGM